MELNPKFYCSRCDFRCNKKTDYTRHVNTKKHQKRCDEPVLACSTCGKTFNSRTTLWRHTKKCNSGKFDDDNNVFTEQEEQQGETHRHWHWLRQPPPPRPPPPWNGETNCAYSLGKGVPPRTELHQQS